MFHVEHSVMSSTVGVVDLAGDDQGAEYESDEQTEVVHLIGPIV